MHLIYLVTLIINIYGLGGGSRSHFLKQIPRLIYCFFLVKSCFFIEKVHILRITHFSKTTKDRKLIFGMGGDAYGLWWGSQSHFFKQIPLGDKKC
jgi:thermostable 8-oxoguanine DNA glycosylase